ncbi:hypothetical protein C5E11_00675 [Clavibacter michiganensis]|nr:hypothetical protein [Clavibacter michiganensis]PPF65435.1 hypothetical protein C5E11_00675 [Clavibacter michiganensis]
MSHAAPKRRSRGADSFPADYPGRSLGLVSLVFAIIVPIVGFILSLIAQRQSKAAGYPNQLAKLGFILASVLLVFGVVVVILYVVVGSLAVRTGY